MTRLDFSSVAARYKFSFERLHYIGLYFLLMMFYVGDRNAYGLASHHHHHHHHLDFYCGLNKIISQGPQCNREHVSLLVSLFCLTIFSYVEQLKMLNNFYIKIKFCLL